MAATLKLLIAAILLLVQLATASPQFIRFPIDGRSSSAATYEQPQMYAPHAEVRKRQQVPVKSRNHTKPAVVPILPALDSGDVDIANSIRNSRQVIDNSLLSQFPKIYKVDDFIIIANPKVKAPPPCVPAPQPMFYPQPPRPTATQDEDLGNRLGAGRDSNEPSRCVWAIVACCSPGSKNIRYACFELLGCPGAFWDLNPCEERVVMAAANTALQFYMSNSTSSSTPALPSS